MSEKKPPAKRRWYHNMADAYRISARSYPWIPWVLVGTAISVIGLFLIIAAVAVLTSNHLVGHAAVRLGVPLALIVTGLLGLAAGNMRTHGGIGGAGPSGAPTPTTTRHNATGQGEP